MTRIKLERKDLEHMKVILNAKLKDNYVEKIMQEEQLKVVERLIARLPDEPANTGENVSVK